MRRRYCQQPVDLAPLDANGYARIPAGGRHRWVSAVTTPAQLIAILVLPRTSR
jgi:hypothetical protein